MALSGTQFCSNTQNDFVTSAGLCNLGKTFVTVTSGSTYTVPLNAYRFYLRGILLIAAFTIQLPATNVLMDGKVINFISNVAITLITLKAGTGDTIADALAGIGSQQMFSYQYDYATKAWYRAA